MADSTVQDIMGKLSTSNTKEEVRYALFNLLNLAGADPGARTEAVNAGVMPYIMDILLTYTETEILDGALGALGNLTTSPRPASLAIEAGAVIVTVEVLRRHHNVRLIEAGLTALSHMTWYPRGKIQAMQADSVSLIIDVLSTYDDDAKIRESKSRALTVLRMLFILIKPKDKVCVTDLVVAMLSEGRISIPEHEQLLSLMLLYSDHFCDPIKRIYSQLPERWKYGPNLWLSAYNWMVTNIDKNTNTLNETISLLDTRLEAIDKEYRQGCNNMDHNDFRTQSVLFRCHHTKLDRKLLDLEYKMLLTRFKLKPHMDATADQLYLSWLPAEEEGQIYISVVRELILLRADKLRDDLAGSKDCKDFLNNLVSANTMNPQQVDTSEIKNSVSRLANSLRDGIKNPVLSAKVAGVGSFFDDCKLSPADEFDMCLVLRELAVDGANFQTELIDEKNLFYDIKIISEEAQKALAGVSEKGYLMCEAVHRLVYEALKDVLKDISLPDNLTFAKIYSSESPGIQPTPPTITFHLVYKGQPLSFDFTPTLPAPKAIVLSVIQSLSPVIQERLRSSTTISRQVEYPYEMVDFIVSKYGHWQLSTSCLEAHLLQTFKPMAGIKQNIIACKAFCNQYLQLDALPLTRYFNVCMEDIKSTISSSIDMNWKTTQMFKAFLMCMDTDSCLLMFQAISELGLEERITLDTHISHLAEHPEFLSHYTHPALLRRWQIAAKKLVSTASCVFKYLMIRSFLENPDDPCWSDDTVNSGQVIQILEKYQSQVQLDSNAGSVRQGFLEYDIPVRSVSLYAMDKRVPGVGEEDLLQLHTEAVILSISQLSDV